VAIVGKKPRSDSHMPLYCSIRWTKLSYSVIHIHGLIFQVYPDFKLNLHRQRWLCEWIYMHECFHKRQDRHSTLLTLHCSVGILFTWPVLDSEGKFRGFESPLSKYIILLKIYHGLGTYVWPWSDCMYYNEKNFSAWC